MKKGVITIWVLVFGAMFLIIFSGLVTFFVFQINQNKKIEARNVAFHIAEAGIEYAKWHLAHSPEDFNFSGIYDFKDPQGGVIGKFELQITPPTPCEDKVKIVSVGWSILKENEKRKISAIYQKPSLARYAFLTNSNVWFGPDEALKGPFHSNGGIRMDGSQNSLSTSARETYICGPEHGCSFNSCFDPCHWTEQGCECPGIWGEGEGGENGLWKYPYSNVDFNSILKDLNELKNIAQSAGIYIADPSEFGFHLHFNSDGTVTVYKVKKLKKKVWGYDGERWILESNSIERENFFAQYSLPQNCAPVFVENNVWVDGVVNGKVTVVAAKLPETHGNQKKIIIWGNLTVANKDSVIGLIAQKDVLIPLYAPNNLEIHAAILAQKGHIFRYYYPYWWFEPYRTYAIREKISTYGSLISNTIWTFSWVDASGRVVSGYRQTEMNYDSSFLHNPPPYFPKTGDYQLTFWEELEQ